MYFLCNEIIDEKKNKKILKIFLREENKNNNITKQNEKTN